jgi:hypothetical protein
MVPVTADADFDAALEAIAKKVQKKECILFLGSGVHAGPPADQSTYLYPEEDRPLSAKSLSNELATASGFGDTFDESPDALQRTSGWFESKRTRKELIELVQNAVQTDRKPSAIVRALAQLSFPVVATTNYDRLFEDALRDPAVGKEPQLVIYNPKREATPTPPAPSADKPLVFKLHGDISIPESIVITDEDYIQFMMRMSDPKSHNPLPLSFHYHFMLWPTLFVGYSLMDYNLRLLFKTLRWNVDISELPATYSLDMKPDPLIFDVWYARNRYVEFITQDVWTFVPRLYERVVGQAMQV